MNIFVRVLFALSIYRLRSVCFAKRHPWQEKFTLHGSVCTTSECYNQAEFIQHIMDPKVDPCDDFYKYVCANWPIKHSEPAYYSEISIDTEMGERSFNNIRLILEEPIMPYDSSEMRMAKIFNKRCSEIPYLGLHDNVVILSYVRGSGYFPLFNPLHWTFKQKPWMDVHNYYLSLTGESALFHVALHNDRSRNYVPIFHILKLTSPYGLFIPNELFSFTKLGIYKQVLRMMLRRIVTDTKYWKSDSMVEKDLTDVLNFRRELQSIIQKHFITDNRHSIITVRKLDQWYGEISTVYKPTARISWFEVLKTLHKKPYSRNDIEETFIDVTNKMYFQLLGRLLNETPEDVIVNHIHLYFIERHFEIGPYLKSKMMDVITEEGKLIGTIRYIGKRWHICIASNQVTDAVGTRYVQKYFSADTKLMAGNLVRRLKNMMKLMISDSTWLDMHSKNTSKQMISDMLTTIGYPHFYDDRSKIIDFVNRKVIEPGRIDALYSPESNSISISAAYLTLPMFSVKLPPAVTNGATAMNIAHQMYLAFGTNQIERHEIEYFLPHDMLEMYRKKMECFVQKYDGVPVTELQNIHPIPRINGNTTVDENMADIMGLKLAFQVFKKNSWIEKTCETLPNLPGISCWKLFFISFAMSHCSVLTPDAMLELTELGVQSTPRVRVNTAVANMKEFGKIFKCSKKARLNASKRCDLWT